MKANGMLFYRIGTTLVMVLFALAVAVPMTVSADPTLAALPKSDDFNTCGLNTTLWKPFLIDGGPAVGITAPFTGNSLLDLTIPAGKDYTFSDKNTNAPHIMQTITDENFEVEVKFNTPLGKTPEGTWNIQGILVEDTTVAGNPTWLRFDVNSVTKAGISSINYYIGRYDETTNVLADIVSPKLINATDFATSPVFLRLEYVKATGEWNYSVGLGSNTTWAAQKSFLESRPSNLHPDPINFAATRIGIFAGSTSTTVGAIPPGIKSQVDYFKLMSDTQFVDDAITLKVTTAGAGKGAVDFPIADQSSQCSGNVLQLTASPNTGSIFDSWTGDITNKANPLNLTMDKSYTLVANFKIPPEPPVIPVNKLFVPIFVK